VRALTISDYAGAERGFQAVLREEPANVAALSNLGVIYSRTGRADQAITMYRRALELSPDDKALLVNLGLVYLRQETTNGRSRCLSGWSLWILSICRHDNWAQFAAPTAANRRQRSGIWRRSASRRRAMKTFCFCWGLST